MAANKVKETRVHLASGVTDTLKLKRGQTVACELKQLDVLLRTNKAEPEQRFGTVDVKPEGENEMGIRSTTITNGKVIETYIETRPFQFKPTEQTEEPMKHMTSKITNVAIGGSTDEVIAKLNAKKSEQEVQQMPQTIAQTTVHQAVTQVTQPKETIMATTTTVDNTKTAAATAPVQSVEQTQAAAASMGIPIDVIKALDPIMAEKLEGLAQEALDKKAKETIQETVNPICGVGISWNADAALKAAEEHPEADVACVEKKTLSEKIKGLSLTNKILLGVGATAAIAGIGFGGFKYYQNRKGSGDFAEMTNTVGG